MTALATEHVVIAQSTPLDATCFLADDIELDFSNLHPTFFTHHTSMIIKVADVSGL